MPFQRSTSTPCRSVPTAMQCRRVAHETEVRVPRIAVNAQVTPVHTWAALEPTATQRVADGQPTLCRLPLPVPAWEGRWSVQACPLKRSARLPQRPQVPPVVAYPTAVQRSLEEQDTPISSLSGDSPAPWAGLAGWRA